MKLTGTIDKNTHARLDCLGVPGEGGTYELTLHLGGVEIVLDGFYDDIEQNVLDPLLHDSMILHPPQREVLPFNSCRGDCRQHHPSARPA